VSVFVSVFACLSVFGVRTVMSVLCGGYEGGWFTAYDSVSFLQSGEVLDDTMSLSHLAQSGGGIVLLNMEAPQTPSLMSLPSASVGAQKKREKSGSIFGVS